jgi:hypothetical protein
MTPSFVAAAAQAASPSPLNENRSWPPLGTCIHSMGVIAAAASRQKLMPPTIC